MQHLTMKNLPKGQQPSEKCKILGPEFLSDEELLAVLFRSGTQSRRVTEMTGEILSVSREFGGLSGLSRIPFYRLKQIRGVGEIRAIQLQCICELCKRMQRSDHFPDRVCINHPETLANYMKGFLLHLQVEELWAVYLDGRNRILLQKCTSKGDALSSQVSVREIFKDALQIGAVSLILVHNHPSGDSKPSKADLDVTYLVKEAGNILGISLLDHIIITSCSYYSMREANAVCF